MNRPFFTLLVFLLMCSPCYGFGFDSLSDIASGVQEVTTAISDTSKVIKQDKGHSAPLVKKQTPQSVKKRTTVEREAPQSVERRAAGENKSSVAVDEQSLKQMKRIAIMIEGFRVYDSPNQSSQNSFQASAKAHEARCAELAKTVPDYESSTVKIMGKPFAEHIALAKKIIAQNEELFNKNRSRDQMERIAMLIEGFRVYSYKPDQRSQDNFYASIKEHEARCAELAKTVPDYESSTVEINGKPFSEYIALVKKIIAQNEEQFNKVTYDAMAVGAMKNSLKFCSKGAESIKNIVYTEAYYEKISKIKYDVTLYFNSSVEIDKKVNDLFEKELKICGRNFLAPYKEYKRKYAKIKEEEKKEEAKKRAEAKAKKDREAKAISEQHAKAMHDYAVSKGLSEYFFGIDNLLSNIARRSISVDQARTYAIESTNADKYEVQSLDSEVVFYSYVDNHFKVRQIAVKRERNGVYMEGTKLQGHYKFLTFIEAQTVLGVTKQIAVFESIE